MNSLSEMDIRSLRNKLKIKQKDLAKKAKVPYSELSKCERGLAIPESKFFTSIAKVLSISPSKLLKTHTDLFNNPISGEGYVTKKTKHSFVIDRKKEPSKTIIPILDLFCGTGGFSHGFEQTGKFKVIAGLDLLSDRIDTFSSNHLAAKSYCYDIFDFSISEFKKDIKPDVIIGGPPCQGFSSIRPFRSISENDARNNLFEYFALVVKELKPKWFVLENVVGLLTHQKGETMKRLSSIFEEIGYKLSWTVLNTAHFGLPQRRERFIMVGNIEGKEFEFPKPTHYFNGRSMTKKNTKFCLDVHKKNLEPAVTVMEAIGDLPKINAGESSSEYQNNQKLTDYQKKMRQNEKKLTLHTATTHSVRMLEIIKHSGANINSIPEGMVKSGFSTSYSRLNPDEPSMTITVNFGFPGSNKCIHPYQNRALTPREAARLQGFEDDYMFMGNRNDIVKQIGNAVPPILGKVIGNAILKQM